MAKLIVKDEIKDSILEKRKRISSETTPNIFVKRKNDGYDYVEEAYLRSKLNEEYPLWSWSPAGDNPVQFLGSEWVVVSGTLRINEDGYTKEFFSPGAARIQFKRGSEHVPENVVDIDKNVASANTNGFKRAVNRLTNIADDVYRKQVIDPSLSDEEVEMIESLMEELDDSTKDTIREGIKNLTINKTNIKRTIERIETIIKQQRSNNE
tara:strand:+ start:6970 stop:7596 length:627 start_codon:yes stop_codon:yes gene_type:complete